MEKHTDSCRYQNKNIKMCKDNHKLYKKKHEYNFTIERKNYKN